MFTGIIEETGKIRQITNNKLEIECTTVLENTKLGDSIAVNGVCLTVTNMTSNSFMADVSPETYIVSCLGTLKSNDYVNLERALHADGRFGGHIVSGHIDGRGKCIELSQKTNFYDLKIELTPDLSKYVVKKGSITINGISLTVAEINENIVRCSIIPHTYQNTSLKYLQYGNYVNVETDILARYVEKFLSTSDNKSRIDLELLENCGFC